MPEVKHQRRGGWAGCTPSGEHGVPQSHFVFGHLESTPALRCLMNSGSLRRLGKHLVENALVFMSGCRNDVLGAVTDMSVISQEEAQGSAGCALATCPMKVTPLSSCGASPCALPTLEPRELLL